MVPTRLLQSIGLSLGFALAAGSRPALAQAGPDNPPSETSTIFPHPPDTWWWLSAQVNVISQAHGTFTSPYEGDNSLRAAAEHATSRLWTIYTGVKLPAHTEFLFDVESAGGRGLSDALGLAGFTNLDVVRNPTLGAAPYLARILIHTTIALTIEMVEVTPSAMSLASRVPARRIEIRAGKLGMADFFDLNSAGSDSHLQFTNWTVDNNGAYDYAADTRGYTCAAIIEYDTPRWSVRFAEALMPTVANGIDMDWDLARARAENLEIEIHPADGFVMRALAYANHANMGSYSAAIDGFRSGVDPRPDVVAYREQGRVKSGFGLNTEYAFPNAVRVFARTGWNDGDTESFAYTEVNNSLQVGGDATGGSWGRARDRVGVAFVSNGLSEPHRTYLALGGNGFLLGDGALNYGREEILETYYTAHLWRGVSASAGAQYITHPGYNQDRGPVLFGMLRLHLDL